VKHMIFFLFALAALAALVGQGAAPAAVEAAQLPASHLLEPASRDPLMVEALSWTAVGSLAHARAEHTATLLSDGRVLVVGGFASGSALASTEIYDPATGRWSQAAPLQQPRYRHTATLLLDGRVLVAGGQYGGVNVPLASVELYDPHANTWSAGASLPNGSLQHTATLMQDGTVLLTGGFDGGDYLAGTLRYDPATNLWVTLAPMATRRTFHSATLLSNGKVLVVGGFHYDGPPAASVSSAELYDPQTNIWSSAGNLLEGRENHSATLLPDGRVLVAGGDDVLAFSLASSEIYDPTAATWVNAPPVDGLTTPRRYHAATLLPNGRLLVTGGEYWGANAALNTSELYNPATNLWTNAGNLSQGRRHHTSTLLANGSVLVAGGYNAAFVALASAEVLDDPQRVTAATNDSINTARSQHAATLLLDGRVLVTGGGGSSGPLSSAELYDRATNSWSFTGSMNVARAFHTATLLPDGRVLVAGGMTLGGAALYSAEVYDPKTATWSYVGSMLGSAPDGRAMHSATLLADGRVLVAGGQADVGTLVSNVEIFDPQTNAWSDADPLPVARSTHKATLMKDGNVFLTGGYRLGPTATVDVYDPESDAWHVLGAPMLTARILHTATLLPDGRLLVAGGINQGNWLATTELFDPATGSWSAGAPLTYGRAGHTATLMPGGRVVFTGGYNALVNLPEVYDLQTNSTWAINVGEPRRSYHTATLMPNGRVLAVGGFGSNHLTWTSEVWYNTGHETAWQPALNPVASLLPLGAPFTLTGSGWRGFNYSGAGGGAATTAATNYPLVQIRRIDNEEILWLPAAAFGATAFTSQPLAGIQRGPVLVTVFVNGIPSASRVTVVADGFRLHLPLIIR
jgi:N-acetylneuraminic acid mutarotase